MSWVSGPVKTPTLDEVLMKWEASKTALATAKETEMSLRKLAVSLGFSEPNEGTNTLELGNGYELKAVVKYNYKLKSPDARDTVQAVDDTIDAFIRIAPNEGSFIAERLFKWKVDLSLSEYRNLVEEAALSKTKKQLLDELNKVLEIGDAAPTLEIKEPKGKR